MFKLFTMSLNPTQSQNYNYCDCENAAHNISFDFGGEVIKILLNLWR